MNQEQNNFNNQNMNQINNNFNNQPVFGQMPNQNVQPINNFPNNNQMNFNTPNKNNKKNLIIVGGLIVVALIIGIICAFALGSDKKEENKKEEKQDNTKEIVYFNKSSRNKTDKIAFNLEIENASHGIFFFFEEKNIAKNLKIDSYNLKNEVFVLSSYDNDDELAVQINGEYFNFSLESEYYTKDETSELYDNEPILYRDRNYIVTEAYEGTYVLDYIYKEDTKESAYNPGKVTGYWYTIRISFVDSIDAAKERIKEIDENVGICAYNVKDGYETCKTQTGKKVNYKDYKHGYDVVIDSLIDYELYIDSYKDVDDIGSGEINIKKNIEYEEKENVDETKLRIENTTYLDETKVIATTTLNGKEVKLRKPYSLYYAYLKYDGSYLEIYVDLPYGISENEENTTKALQETFKKTK